ncbi:MAG: 23S rRNA (adenine(2503)-C(2))-methyltransferase RlmN [Phycisphaerales bacterium]|nr:23S rRNA (adenine(2503)-C(2))-methyltransferase RlmN [Phycisphaerae bacterium]NNF41523.1 23S rRNA (adenine(2503)-C(2))-methyltransferase RlmN [Phycisphaerales bacterium]NNM26628.1 23S rRNA (adenine(2503)-C(2))-methyltransferase RlmN [Phycisphaerales bacterium]
MPDPAPTCDVPIDPLALTSEQFCRAGKRRDHPLTEPLALYRRVLREGHRPDVASVVPPDPPIGVIEREGPTRKFTMRLADGLETESVILPQSSRAGRPRQSLCVSSQVGCAMGCTFCETAQMGLLRNLTPAEIVAQWYAARFTLDAAITHVVFMGMGEPLDNLESVLQAIRVLTDHNGAAIPAAKISVSTVGRIDGIERLAAFVREPGFRQLRLAVSINAPNDAVRDEIMPINRAMPMAALRDTLLAWPARPRLPILIEYVLIPGVNDASAHAEELCRFLRPLSYTLNVIPYNPRRNSPWPAPTEATITRFVTRVQAAGGFVKRRQTMGRSVMGACGQLGNPAFRRRRPAGCG